MSTVADTELQALAVVHRNVAEVVVEARNSADTESDSAVRSVFNANSVRKPIFVFSRKISLRKPHIVISGVYGSEAEAEAEFYRQYLAQTAMAWALPSTS